jgi:MFS transporter, Spinster family, sphingosine-1-phosphate transporter
MKDHPKNRYKWELLALLCLAFFTHQAGRAVLGIVVPDVQRDLGLSDEQMGLVPAFLSVVLGIMIPISGIMGDRYSRKWIITLTLIFGSAATALAGVSSGLITLLLFYSVTSASCEALYAPSGYSLLASYHKRTRAIAMALHQSALYIGVMTCGLLSAGIAERWGWRWAFGAFGLFGILLGVVAAFRLKDTPHDRAEAMGLASRPGVVESLRVLIRIPSALLLTLAFTAIVFVNNIYWFWVPKYMQDQEGLFRLTKTESSGVFTYHVLAALITIICGGLITDRFVKRDPKFRLRLQCAALLLGAPALLMIGRSAAVGSVWLFCALYGVFRGLFEVNTHTSLFDVVPTRYRATAVGLMTMFGFLAGGTIGPWVVGFLMKRMGTQAGMLAGFRLMAAAYLMGSLAMFISWKFTFNRDRVVEEEIAAL